MAKQFSVVLIIGNETFKGKGTTSLEALTALKRPDKIMSKGVLTVTNGKLKKILALNPVKIKQLFFTSQSLLAVKAKQIFAGMK